MVIGEVWLEALLIFLIFVGGLVIHRALLPEPSLPFLEASMLATGVYSQLDCRLTQAMHGRPRSHFVLRSTHSRHDSVGLLRFCFGFALGVPALLLPLPMVVLPSWIEVPSVRVGDVTMLPLGKVLLVGLGFAPFESVVLLLYHQPCFSFE